MRCPLYNAADRSSDASPGNGREDRGHHEASYKGWRHFRRRDFLRVTAGGTAAAWTSLAGVYSTGGLLAPLRKQNLADKAPAAPVAIRRCQSYDPQEVYRELSAAIDAVGGLRDLVAGKTVVVKVNMTGPVRDFRGRPASETYHIHPTFVEAFCALADQAGARRIVIVEALYYREPMEVILQQAGWNLQRLQSAGGHKVLWENTKNMGSWKKYSRLTVPWGGYLYPAFDVNQWYEKGDVIVSLAKLKDHGTAGVTMAVKNMFGILPTALYGDDAPNEDSLRARVAILHLAKRKVPDGVPAEVGPEISTDPLERVPRVTADIYGIRPADLAIVDGVLSIKGGEGFWNQGVDLIEPKLLLVGRNGVCVDAVCTAVMGYDPMAPHGSFPFPGENHLQLAAEAGLGTNDLKRIEVRGLSIQEALCPFRTPSEAVPVGACNRYPAFVPQSCWA
jgi:uncharacterized protein (DUF362 family)